VSSGRTYTQVNGAAIPYTSTSGTILLLAAAGANSTLDIQRVGVATYSGSGVSYPNNATLLFQLCRVSVTGAIGGNSDTPNPHNPADVAAQGTFLDGSVAITNITQGVVLWQNTLPFTAGANWAEWVTPGAEWRVAASGTVGLYVTASSAGTATDLECALTFIM
jgi:hypothetical protein